MSPNAPAYLQLKLKTADKSVPFAAPTPTAVQLTNSDNTPARVASYLTGPDGVVVKPTQPILPLISKNVTAPATDVGYVLNGIGFLGGTYSDEASVTPLTAAQATELRGVHAPFYTDVLFPTQPYSANYFDAFGAAGGSPVAGGVTRLMVTPVQHISSLADLTRSTRRTFSAMDFRLFYGGDTSSYCYRSAPFLVSPGPRARAGSRSVRPHSQRRRRSRVSTRPTTSRHGRSRSAPTSSAIRSRGSTEPG